MVFYAVGGTRFPLFGRAEEMPIQIVLKRRLYAVETWLAIGGLCIYLAITEVLPEPAPAISTEGSSGQAIACHCSVSFARRR